MSILRSFIKYASLNMLAMMSVSAFFLVDTFFVAQGLGANGLTALNLALPIYNVIHGIALMLGVGSGAYFSRLQGRAQGGHESREEVQKKANKLFGRTLQLTFAFAALFFAIGLFFSDPVVRLLGADEEVFADTKVYAQVLFLFAPVSMLGDVIQCYVQNDNDPRRSMWGTVSASMFNIVFDYVFIFPMKMGMFGAVLATSLAPIVSMLVMAPHWKHTKLRPAKVRPSWTMIKTTFSLGLPSFITELSSGIVIIVFNLIILGISGNIGVAAYGVVANISLVMAALFTGLAQGMQPLVSQAYGARNAGNIHRLLKYGVVSVILMSAVMYAILFLWTDPIAAVFNSENSSRLQIIAVEGVKLYFTALPFMGFNIIMAIFFAAINRPVPAQAVSLMRGLFVLVPAAFIMAKLWNMPGVWLSFTVTEFVVTVMAVVMMTLPKVKR